MIRRVVISAFLAFVLVGCSLFVSLDGLTDGGADASASDAMSQSDAANDADTTDANADGGVDAAPYFVVDDCVSDSNDVIDLTTAGTTDWVHWGTDADSKKVAKHLIGPLLQSVNGNNPYSNDSRVFSWTDGTNVPSVASTTNGIYDDTGPMMLTILASPSRSSITLYTDTFSANATWMVALNPGPAAVTRSMSGQGSATTRYRCTIHVSSAVAATVTITFSIANVIDIDAGGGNVALIAGTISPE